MQTRKILAAMLCALATTLAADAAERPVIAVGDRVRVETDVKTLKGDVLAIDDDSLLLAPARRPNDGVRVSWSSVQSISVSQGKGPATLKGALIGGVVGGFLPALVFGALSAGSCDGCAGAGAVLGLAIYGPAGAGVGALTGAVIGGASREEKWKGARLPDRSPRVAFGLVPRGDGAQAALSLRF